MKRRALLIVLIIIVNHLTWFTFGNTIIGLEQTLNGTEAIVLLDRLKAASLAKSPDIPDTVGPTLRRTLEKCNGLPSIVKHSVDLLEKSKVESLYDQSVELLKVLDKSFAKLLKKINLIAKDIDGIENVIDYLVKSMHASLRKIVTSAATAGSNIRDRINGDLDLFTEAMANLLDELVDVTKSYETTEVKKDAEALLALEAIFQVVLSIITHIIVGTGKVLENLGHFEVIEFLEFAGIMTLSLKEVHFIIIDESVDMKDDALKAASIHDQSEL